MQIRRILVPLDGSKFAETALPKAIELARLYSAQLFLVTVHAEDTSQEQAESYLFEQVKRWQAQDLKVMVLAKQGDPAKVIVEEAKAQQADFIVMSTHGHTGLMHNWVGSVTEEVVRRAPCPTLVVRPELTASKPSFSPNGRIVVPLDGSAESEAALAWVEALYAGREIHLVRVVDVRQVYYSATPFAPELAHRLTEQARAYLQRIAARLESRGVRVHTSVRVGSPRQEILLAAQQQDGSLIVMGTHARRGAGRALLGSVAESVCRAAVCPVLVVQPETAGVRLAAERVLIALDGSRLAEKALHYVAHLPASQHRKITLVRVADLPGHLVATRERYLESLSEYVEDQAAALRKTGNNVQCRVLSGDAVARLAEAADPEHYDLLVMTTHGHSGFARWMLGSVAESVARRSRIPVLLLNASAEIPEGALT